MLTNFYKVLSVDEQEAGKFTAQVSLNAEHDVFKGHFPGNPVTPGVCMMQIIKDITQEVTGLNLRLQSATNVKFMALINPFETPDLSIELDIQETNDDMIKVRNTTTFNDTVALKLSSIYIKV